MLLKKQLVDDHFAKVIELGVVFTRLVGDIIGRRAVILPCVYVDSHCVVCHCFMCGGRVLLFVDEADAFLRKRSEVCCGSTHVCVCGGWGEGCV